MITNTNLKNERTCHQRTFNFEEISDEHEKYQMSSCNKHEFMFFTFGLFAC